MCDFEEKLTLSMKQMSNEKKNNGGLGYIGDEVLPSYVEIIIVNKYKDPYHTHTIGPKALTS